MVAVFLQGELSSGRFGPWIREALEAERADERVVVSPRLDDPGENAVRRRVLGATRGYGCDRWLFGGFPPDVLEGRVRLTA